MELLSSMFNIVKNVSDTDRQFKLLREKLVFNIKKGEAALTKYQKQRHVPSWVAEPLESRLRDAREKQTLLDTLLSSSNQQGISLKEKFKLNLPFNNQRDKISQVIEDLRTATEEVMNGTITHDPLSAKKHKLPSKDMEKQEEKQEKPHFQQLQVDNQIDEIYEMGPTIQENNAIDIIQEIIKNPGVALKVETKGLDAVLKVLEESNKFKVIQHDCQSSSKDICVELYKLGRINFKGEYKILKPIYPDIDKISKNAHFTLKWLRNVQNIDKSQSSELYNRKSQTNHLETSQKKEQNEQFFTVREGEHTEISNGQIVLEKETRTLYRKLGQKWVKVEESSFEVSNGQEVAVSLNKNLLPDLFFKINYEWK